MTTTELLSYHQHLCDKARAIMEKKNHDYAGASGTTPFANFEATEKLGLASTEEGMLIRSVDKIQRLKTFIQVGILKVEDEGPENAVLDIINYMVLLSAYIKQEKANEIKVGVDLAVPGEDKTLYWDTDAEAWTHTNPKKP